MATIDEDLLSEWGRAHPAGKVTSERVPSHPSIAVAAAPLAEGKESSKRVLDDPNLWQDLGRSFSVETKAASEGKGTKRTSWSSGFQAVTDNIFGMNNRPDTSAPKAKKKYRVFKKDGGGKSGDVKVKRSKEEALDHYSGFDDEGETIVGARRYVGEKDLDKFYQQAYQYYRRGGFATILISQVTEILSLLFGVAFSSTVFIFLDWGRLLQCGKDPVQNVVVDCGEISSYLSMASLRAIVYVDNPSVVQIILLLFEISASLFTLWKIVQFIPALMSLLKMRHYFTKTLRLSARELETMSWSHVIAEIVRKDDGKVTIHDITNRILRRENYMIALINKEVLDLPSLPFIGKGGAMTKQLEWNLFFILFNQMFDNDMMIDSFVRYPYKLRLRFFFVGLANLFFAPFIWLTLMVHFFMSNIEELHSSKDVLGPRRYSLLAKWMFREFNELDHFFESRLNRSLLPSIEYTTQFPSPAMEVLGKFIALITGTFVGILLLFSILDENILLYVRVFDRSLVFYLGIFGTVSAAARSVVRPPEKSVYSPNAVMMKVYKYTHYMPIQWRGRCNTLAVRDEFLSLFQYKLQLFLNELISVFTTPLILMFHFSRQTDTIIDFIEKTTIEVENVGCICSFAQFDVTNYGDARYAAPKDGAHQIRAADGKMEKSFFAFVANHPHWDCASEGGKELVDNLAKFQMKESQSFIKQKNDPVSSSLGLSAFSLPCNDEDGGDLVDGSDSLLYNDPSLLLPMSTFDVPSNKRSTSDKYMIWLDKYFERSVMTDVNAINVNATSSLKP